MASLFDVCSIWFQSQQMCFTSKHCTHQIRMAPGEFLMDCFLAPDLIWLIFKFSLSYAGLFPNLVLFHLVWGEWFRLTFIIIFSSIPLVGKN